MRESRTWPGDLAARGSTVLVHGFFTERGDLFGPGVIANTGPLALSDLMTMLGAPEPAGRRGAGPAPRAAPGTVGAPDGGALRTGRPSGPSGRRPGATASWRPSGTAATGRSRGAAPGQVRRSDRQTGRFLADIPGCRHPRRRPRTRSCPRARPCPRARRRRRPGRARGAPSPNDWENLTGWSWEETAPEPGDTFDPREAAAALAAPAAPVHRRGRRRPVLAAALAVLVLAGTAVGVTTLTAGSETAGRPTRAASSPPAPSPARTPGTPTPGTRTSQAKPSRPPASAPTSLKPVQEYVPGQVRIVDGRISIEVTWTDRSGGRAAHYVVGGPSGRPPSTLASAAPGTAKVTVTALNPSVDYCLTVVAVMDVDRVSQAKPVCTHRVPRRG
ncbi:hypothetical protein LUX57_27835 [Actinomadura madurae]|uniref:hypothetical protein n=1 Tax=Actinomadura madurae TaxID=1993 RepID=UPI0020D21C70|nr:hypothetical protein [Actinomadura madurae]MCP9968502.1 hypothetical protein [Actinomadura madurae]